jgi:hypothetical protein
MLEFFGKLFWSIAKSYVLAPVFREIFQIAFKSNFVCIVWSIGFQASRTKREPRAEIGGRGCMQGARPVIRADYKKAADTIYSKIFLSACYAYCAPCIAGGYSFMLR